MPDILPLTYADLRAFSDQIIRIQQTRVNQLTKTVTYTTTYDEALDRFHRLLLERAELEACLATALALPSEQ